MTDPLRALFESIPIEGDPLSINDPRPAPAAPAYEAPPRPPMPDLTPNDKVGAATVLAFLALVLQVESEWVQLACVVCAALVAGALAWADTRRRMVRNGTEQVKMETEAALRSLSVGEEVEEEE